MNVVLLAAGGNDASVEGEGYPFCLSELQGQPLIEILLDKWVDIQPHFAVMLREDDIKRYHLDHVVNQITPNATVYPIPALTAGAACTALMAIDQINNDEPLVIINADELLDIDYAKALKKFQDNGFDAGTIIFESVHPRYSYVKIDDDGVVNEAAEKNPISRNATAGFYWYRQGKDFVEVATRSMRKHAVSNEPYFICPLFNEMILDQKRVGTFRIDKSLYKPFKSQQQVQQFRSMVENLL